MRLRRPRCQPTASARFAVFAEWHRYRGRREVTECAERPTTAERLLSREQISAICDLEWLEQELDRVTAAAKQIEVDLEFRSDDYATDQWEHRARKALAAHHICQGHLTRRIHALRKGDKPKGPTDADVQNAKARKQEAHAARVAAEAEARRDRIEAERERTFRAMVAFADRQNFLARFYAEAKRALAKEVFAAIQASAGEALRSALNHEHAQAIEARQGPDPKGLDAKHESAVAKPCAQTPPGGHHD